MVWYAKPWHHSALYSVGVIASTSNENKTPCPDHMLATTSPSRSLSEGAGCDYLWSIMLWWDTKKWFHFRGTGYANKEGSVQLSNSNSTALAGAATSRRLYPCAACLCEMVLYKWGHCPSWVSLCVRDERSEALLITDWEHWARQKVKVERRNAWYTTFARREDLYCVTDNIYVTAYLHHEVRLLLLHRNTVQP